MGDLEPALVERMVALVRNLAECPPDIGAGAYHCGYVAREIAKLLPEPVDPDLIEAERIARDSADDFITPYPPARLERLTSHIYAAIKRGRELQKAEA